MQVTNVYKIDTVSRARAFATNAGLCVACALLIAAGPLLAAFGVIGG